MSGRAGKRALALRHVAFEGVGLWAETLRERGYELEIVDIGLQPIPRDTGANYDLLIALGGPIGVYETEAYPFLIDEIAVIRARLEAQRPVLGVCLGAQLMAAALGARVAPGPGKEIGYAPVQLSAEGLASPLAAIEGVSVLHWHGDNLDLPPGAQPLASTALCPNQAFRIGDFALALQFHVETDPAAIEAWLIGHAAELAAAGVDPRKLRADAARHGGALARAARAVLGAWLDGIAA